MENGICTGIVEVEGTDSSKAIDRMVKYIVPENRYWRIEFDIFIEGGEEITERCILRGV